MTVSSNHARGRLCWTMKKSHGENYAGDARRVGEREIERERERERKEREKASSSHNINSAVVKLGAD